MTALYCKHLSSQFDNELNQVTQLIMEMGGLVEQQMVHAIEALMSGDTSKAQTVMDTEDQVNKMEMTIDQELTSIISRRQPTARDLRLLIAISRSTANLERAGDEANKIARIFLNLARHLQIHSLPLLNLRHGGDMAIALLRKALDALARLDTQIALDILRSDSLIDQEFDNFTRTLVTYIVEDQRTISCALDLMLMAKAIERIGDHSKNIAECVIYIVNGQDVRHTPIQDIESQLQQ